MTTIIKYNAGNITSVKIALYNLGVDSIITDDPEKILKADRVIFPGVGAAHTAMKYLREKNLDRTISQIRKPFLGICLGLQLMCQYSEEGNVDCLGIYKSNVKKFNPIKKVPHMGWNNLSQASGKLLKGITTEDNQYYVHSYFAQPCKNTTGICDYINPISAVMEKDNFFATQFHPEKSAKVGSVILKNFINL